MNFLLHESCYNAVNFYGFFDNDALPHCHIHTGNIVVWLLAVIQNVVIDIVNSKPVIVTKDFLCLRLSCTL